MKYFFILFLFHSYLINIDANYIVIPFDSMIYNPKNDLLIHTDVLSSKMSEDLYFNLTIGNPKQTLKIFIRLDQYELRIKEPKYNSSLSKTFNYYLIKDRIICQDSIYFVTINSQEDLNDYIHNKAKKEKEIIKEYNNVAFVYLNDSTNNRFLETELIYYDSDKLLKYNYGMLGFRNRNIKWNNYPQFVESLKEAQEIKKSIFSFIFNKDENSEPLGYIIIGDLFIDTKTEYEEVNVTNYALRGGSMSWDLSLETIYSESNKDNLNSFYERNINVELRVELSYIFGSENYRTFLEKEFFNDLMSQKVCQYKEVQIDLTYRTFVCNGKSSIFEEYYNSKFPELLFKIKNIDDKFILTKEDLFFKNTKDKSDTNIYFRVFFHAIKTSSWQFGRTFLQKYRFSFDYDNNNILYHKSKIKDNVKENAIIVENSDNSKILKIILIVFFFLIIFILGFLFHKSIIKKPRKSKTNELEDEYYYQSEDKTKKINNGFDINNDNINSKEKQLYLELGTHSN